MIFTPFYHLTIKVPDHFGINYPVSKMRHELSKTKMAVASRDTVQF